MLITDVVNEVKRYHSFDLDERELYMWCNEVGSLLRRGGCDKTGYAPIRLICYRGEAYIDPEKSSIRTMRGGFIKGDMLNVRSVSGGIMTPMFTGLEIFAVKYDGIGYVIRVTDGALAGTKPGMRECVITRAVTDKTICNEPFDGMYIDYLLAKINLIKRNYTDYSKYLRAFGKRLSEYKSLLSSETPQAQVFISSEIK